MGAEAAPRAALCDFTEDSRHPLHGTTLTARSLFVFAPERASTILRDMDPVGKGARNAAKRLEGSYGKQLRLDVEVKLRDGDSEEYRVIDPVSLGTLVVSVATLAWTIYRDLKNDGGGKPPMVVIINSVRRQLDWEGDVDTTQHSELIEATVEETIAAAEEAEK
jgi:hypothetical protein